MNVADLRALAVSHQLFEPTDLAAAVRRLGFVQADPIRAPARAQDLILRPRVEGYVAGDLGRAYPASEYEEDLLYAYGFMRRDVWRALHPRPAEPLDAFHEAVLGAVRRRGRVHPRELDAEFGTTAVRNAWGGQSRATKRALDALHLRGHLRVAERRRGIRVYAIAEPVEHGPLVERMRVVATTLASLLAPVRMRTLRGFIGRIARRSGDRKAGYEAIRSAVADGALSAARVDGVEYVWPAIERRDPHRDVHFLAPFDPLVHDRDRFEHLWGWAYRFEAYTPVAKRVRGYYALPVLYRDQVVGWVNLKRDGDALRVDDGYVGGRPRSAAFQRGFDAEVDRMRSFLGGEPSL